MESSFVLMNRLHPERQRALWRWDLQGPQLRHVVKAGNGDATNVIVVQCSVKREEQKKKKSRHNAQ